MMKRKSPFAGLFMLFSVLILIFLFLSFSSPLVPIGRVKIVGAERLEIKKINQYLSAKSSLGLLSTSNKKYLDIEDILGPLAEKIEINSGFFFKATAEVFEKKDTFALGWGGNSTKITVDIEGNYIEEIIPSEAMGIEFSLLSKKVGNTFDFEIPSNMQYPFGLTKEEEGNVEMSMCFKRLVAKLLQTRTNLKLNFDSILINHASSFLFLTNQNEYLLVGPSSFNPVYIMKDDKIAEWTSSEEENKNEEIPDIIMYTKVNLENARGLFGETSQGTTVFFGNATDLDIKFGALGHLLDDLSTSGKSLPLLIKLDIPNQATTVQRNPTIGS